MPKDKQPPRNLWDKPWRLSQYIEEMYGGTVTNKEKFIEIDEEELE